MEPIYLVLGVNCHHGFPDMYIQDARLIKEVCFSDFWTSMNFFISGEQIDKMWEGRDGINSSLGWDFFDAMRSDHFINPRRTGENTSMSSPEIGITSYNFDPYVHPGWEEGWGDYFWFILGPQVRMAIEASERHFDKTPVIAHPPDGVYGPAASQCLKENGIDIVVPSSEHILSENDKGILYEHSGLEHLLRLNTIQINNYVGNPSGLVNDVYHHGKENHIPVVVLLQDIDDGATDYGGWIDLYKGIGNEVRNSGNRVVLVNASYGAHIHPYRQSFGDIWNPNQVNSMIDDGQTIDRHDLRFIDGDRNWIVGDLLCRLKEKEHNLGHDSWMEARRLVMESADQARRNRYFCHDEAITNAFNASKDAAYGILN